ncbi:hypothetical protein Tco_1405740 [Tanacetum coccineum]
MELSEVQYVFYQMEQAVEQHCIESKRFEVKMNQVLNENERLLEQVMSKDIVILLVNPSVENDYVIVLNVKVKQSTSACGSQPLCNTKKDKILQTQSRILKNKVEAYPRKVKSNNKTPKPVVTLVYSRKPRKSKTSVPVNNYKVIKSVTANNSEPSQSRGSIVSNVPSSSLDECRSSKLSSGIWTPAAPSICRSRSQTPPTRQHILGTVKFGNDPCRQRLWVMATIRLECDNSKGFFTLKDFISQNPRGIFINQSKYALESLKKYGFDSCDLVDTPMVEKSKLDEDKEGKAVDPSHYRGTIHQGLWYPKDSSIALTAFADADHAGCQDTRRSTSGSIQLLSDRLVSWSSKRQKSAAISTTEAEYIALSDCCAQILWMRLQLTDYGFGFNKILMYCDNKSAIALCCKEHIENGVIKLYFVNTEYQLADIFTKALGRNRIEFLINKLGMRSFTPETLKQLADEVDE